MKPALGRIASTLLSAGGWLLFGARTVLELIGYATIPDDAEVALSRLDHFFRWLLTVPWWAVLGFAMISTMWLMWVSWPRTTTNTRSHPLIGNEPVPQASADNINPLADAFTQKRINIHDLVTPHERLVSNKTFTDCDLVGSNPVTMEGCVIKHTGFIACDFIHPKKNVPIQNVILLKDCTFMRGRFLSCTIYADTEMMRNFIPLGMRPATLTGDPELDAL